mmetsp:Transcript_13456/g.19918  ORF Transcript_13456/g.19918 Transcript_13456/m.19918 type:complete len:106 (+) Transcript_13456:154-471(+)
MRKKVPAFFLKFDLGTYVEGVCMKAKNDPKRVCCCKNTKCASWRYIAMMRKKRVPLSIMPFLLPPNKNKTAKQLKRHIYLSKHDAKEINTIDKNNNVQQSTKKND